MYKELGDMYGQLNALYELGGIAYNEGDKNTVSDLANQSIEAANTFSLKRSVALQWARYMEVFPSSGKPEITNWDQRFLHESHRMWENLGDKALSLRYNFWFTFSHTVEGYDTCASIIESHDLVDLRRSGDKKSISITLRCLAYFKASMRDYFAARNLLAQSFQLESELGDKRGMLAALQAQGIIELLDGRPNNAESTFLQGLDLAGEIGNNYGVACHKYSLAIVRSRQANWAEAEHLNS